MNITEIVDEKKNNHNLSKEEISFVISSYSRGKINDAKMLDLLRIIDVDNFSYEETYYLADAIARTGNMLDIKKQLGEVVDKHSAGSYSDATTLIFMSVLAAIGLKNVKSLSSVYGEFNNSLDRLNLFSGFSAKISKAKLAEIIENVGAGVFEETDGFAPVDKRIYNLCKKFRIESIPLTAASILCKKIATGASTLVFDVKTGEGAMFKSEIYAETLAKYLVESAKMAGFKASSVITNLDQPLGSSVGLRVEVEEALSVLRSEKSLYSSKLLEVAKELVINALLLSEKATNRPDASKMFEEAISSGLALDKFRELIKAYGGEYVDFKHTPDKLLDGVTVSYLCSSNTGYISDIVISRVVGAFENLQGINQRSIDKNAGIVLLVGEGDKIDEGGKIARIFYNIKNKNFASTINILRDAIEIRQTKPQQRKIFYKVIV